MRGAAAVHRACPYPAAAGKSQPLNSNFVEERGGHTNLVQHERYSVARPTRHESVAVAALGVDVVVQTGTDSPDESYSGDYQLKRNASSTGRPQHSISVSSKASFASTPQYLPDIRPRLGSEILRDKMQQVWLE